MGRAARPSSGSPFTRPSFSRERTLNLPHTDPSWAGAWLRGRGLHLPAGSCSTCLTSMAPRWPHPHLLSKLRTRSRAEPWGPQAPTPPAPGAHPACPRGLPALAALTSHSRQDTLEVVLHVPEHQAGLAHGAASQEDQLGHMGLARGSPGGGRSICLRHPLKRVTG